MKIPKMNKTIDISDEINILDVEISTLANYYFRDLRDEKTFIKYIRSIEKIIRGSIEYRSYIGYLKNNLNITQCTFLPMIDISEIKGVGLEFHHYPFTLFDTVCIVFNNKIVERGGRDSMFADLRISPFEVANEVMKLHYENKVGLVPLSKTVHELAHEGSIFIPLDLVFGNVNEFIKEYKNAITEDQFNLLSTLITLTDKEKDRTTPSILNKKFNYLKIDEFGDIKFIEKREEEKEFA